MASVIQRRIPVTCLRTAFCQSRNGGIVQGPTSSATLAQNSWRPMRLVHHPPTLRRYGNSTYQNTRNNTTNSHSTQLPPLFEPPEETWEVYGTLFTRFILAVGMVHCFSEYVAEITLCEGPSMYPTLQPSGEIVLIDKWTLRRIHGNTHKKGVDSTSTSTTSSTHDDAWIIHDGEERVRRALEKQKQYERTQNFQQNDNVPEWHEPRISVSDTTTTSCWSMLWQLLTTPLSIGDVVVLEHPSRQGTVCKRVLGLPGDTVLRPRKGLLVIPDGHVWVEGDNPANSSDSRNYGTVPMALIQGRVLCRVWPLRGNAIMVRGAPPRNSGSSTGPTGYTILPAGYEGQHIIKTMTRDDQEDEDGSR